MTEIEKIQSKILMRMQDVLDNEQLQKLENVLVLEFHNIEVKQEVENYFPTMSTSNFGKSAFAKALLVAISLILNRRFVEEIESTVIR